MEPSLFSMRGPTTPTSGLRSKSSTTSLTVSRERIVSLFMKRRYGSPVWEAPWLHALA